MGGASSKFIKHKERFRRSKRHKRNELPAIIRHSTVLDTRKIQPQDKLFEENEKTIQSKSLDDLLIIPKSELSTPEMETESLKKSLEKELSLDSRDLRSHAWYHGSIPRHRAEEIVTEEGGFLVRDCTSQPGNYVLTCRTKNHVLHFVINKVIVHPDTVYEKIQFQFEDEAFDTVPDLITFYVGSERPITVASDARIRIPKNRMYPLSHYASKYPSSRFRSPRSSVTSQRGSSDSQKPPEMPPKQHRSQSLTPAEVNRVQHEKCSSADGVIQFPAMTRSLGNEGLMNSKFSSHSLPRNSVNKLCESVTFTSLTLDRNNRNVLHEMNTNPNMRVMEINEESVNYSFPPPKPARISSMPKGDYTSSDIDDVERKNSEVSFIQSGDLQRISSYHASGSDSGNGSGDSALSSVTGDASEMNQRSSGVIIKNPRYHCSFESSNNCIDPSFNYKDVEKKLVQSDFCKFVIPSKIDLENFHSILLPVSDNKPLESQALKGVKTILFESGSRILANHLTRCDLDLIYENGNEKKEKKFYGSNVAALLLSTGREVRKDLIERTNCLKLLVAVTILTCYDEEERTEMINKWIEVAIDTKTALGNLYGFSGIMIGLCLSQIQKLDSTWHLLRQKHTDTAFNFEAKLKPILKNMDNCSNPQAPNTTIPHLLPVIFLLESTAENFLYPNESCFTSSCFTNSQDFGLSVLHNHLEAARKFLALSPNFQRNAEIVLSEAKMEELTLDMFRTEFLMKFLWGSLGARIDYSERHHKFEQLLDLMVEKLCKTNSEV